MQKISGKSHCSCCGLVIPMVVDFPLICEELDPKNTISMQCPRCGNKMHFPDVEPTEIVTSAEILHNRGFQFAYDDLNADIISFHELEPVVAVKLIDIGQKLMNEMPQYRMTMYMNVLGLPDRDRTFLTREEYLAESEYFQKVWGTGKSMTVLCFKNLDVVWYRLAAFTKFICKLTEEVVNQDLVVIPETFDDEDNES